jgi:hypothetical protein
LNLTDWWSHSVGYIEQSLSSSYALLATGRRSIGARRLLDQVSVSQVSDRTSIQPRIAASNDLS